MWPGGWTSPTPVMKPWSPERVEVEVDGSSEFNTGHACQFSIYNHQSKLVSFNHDSNRSITLTTKHRRFELDHIYLVICTLQQLSGFFTSLIKKKVPVTETLSEPEIGVCVGWNWSVREFLRPLVLFWYRVLLCVGLMYPLKADININFSKRSSTNLHPPQTLHMRVLWLCPLLLMRQWYARLSPWTNPSGWPQWTQSASDSWHLP